MLDEEDIKARLERQRLSKPFPMNLAKEDAEHYWIDPKDGVCKLRGKPQFFINDYKDAYQVTEKEYKLKKAYWYKKSDEIKPAKPKANLSQMGNQYGSI